MVSRGQGTKRRGTDMPMDNVLGYVWTIRAEIGFLAGKKDKGHRRSFRGLPHNKLDTVELPTPARPIG